jgi:hypothetical protein
MGICKEIYDKRIDDLDFVMDLNKHGRYEFSETELNRLKWKEMVVHGIPLEVLCRAGMFSGISV